MASKEEVIVVVTVGPAGGCKFHIKTECMCPVMDWHPIPGRGVTMMACLGGHLEYLGFGNAGFDDVIVYAKELPVHYSKAQELIAHIWKTIKPKLAVHMGIAPGSKTATLEQCGKNQGYKQRDVCGACPPGHCCVEGGQDILHSIIDMKTLSRHLQSLGLDVIYSRDAGRFLCDFVYYYSLHLAGGKSVFLHLPTRGALADLDKLLPLLQAVILAMLGQLEAQ